MSESAESVDRLPVVYIAGPYRAPTPWQISENIRTARIVSLTVWRMGAVALCPHANTALFDGEADDSVWLQGDLELLRRCDAVVMLPNFSQSFGARAERDFAMVLGLPVIYAEGFAWPQVIKDWADAWKENRRTAARRSAAAGPDQLPAGGTASPADGGSAPRGLVPPLDADRGSPERSEV